jgi:hypothetical protein
MLTEFGQNSETEKKKSNYTMRLNKSYIGAFHYFAVRRTVRGPPIAQNNGIISYTGAKP